MEVFEEILEADLLAQIVFGIFALITLGGAAYLFFTKNILFGAYGLLTSLLGVAGLFLMAHAEFIAVSQIMIYVGGVLILILFGIMLSANSRNKGDALRVINVNKLLSLLIAFAISAGLGLMIFNLKMAKGAESYGEVNHINALGMHLMTSHVVLLEMIGVLLLVVLIGASYIAKREKL
ncbi:NADH-quinone oxidoreductase subunit J family protein [Arcticibacterium luteifluviistationis]|uniref:NADH-quinone oxidoreductase subunit J n=1 Tax=Arcticibacterium luteifluviistationis TaxID=1784714 RepID=A0A2Z4GGX3_9BACT|nr:NADH-quinone oxidoreductase subunit J [Arcticibacterium luteifluviistationis]AWW00442.1 NADH-quinone oxidoreductase subunit J [Arcticibacterium luteifluviistationis]